MRAGYRWSTPDGLQVGPLSEDDLSALVELGLVAPETPLFDEQDCPLGSVCEQPEMLAALARVQLRASVAKAMSPWTPSPAAPVRLVAPVPPAAALEVEPAPPLEAPEEEVFVPASCGVPAPPLPSGAFVGPGITVDFDLSSEAPLPGLAAPPHADLLEEPVIDPVNPPEDLSYATLSTRIERPPEAAPPASEAGAVSADFDPDVDPWADGLVEGPEPQASAPEPEATAPEPAQVEASLAPASKAPDSGSNRVNAEWVDEDVFGSADLEPVDVVGLEVQAYLHLDKKAYGHALEAFEGLRAATPDNAAADAGRAFCRFQMSKEHAQRVAHSEVVQRYARRTDVDSWTLLFAARMNLELDRRRIAEEQFARLQQAALSSSAIRQQVHTLGQELRARREASAASSTDADRQARDGLSKSALALTALFALGMLAALWQFVAG